MNPYKFVQVSQGHALVKPNRFFSNWVTQSSKQVASNQFVRLHRLSARRVLLEVAISSSVKIFSPAALIVLLVATICTIAGLYSVFQGTSDRSLHSANQASAAPRSKMCEQSALKDVGVSNLGSFEFDNWRFKSSGPLVTIGGIASVEGNALCEGKQLRVRISARMVGSLWRLKQLVPIK